MRISAFQALKWVELNKGRNYNASEWNIEPKTNNVLLVCLSKLWVAVTNNESRHLKELILGVFSNYLYKKTFFLDLKILILIGFVIIFIKKIFDFDSQRDYMARVFSQLSHKILDFYYKSIHFYGDLYCFL